MNILDEGKLGGFNAKRIPEKDFVKVIKRELAVLEDGGGRGVKLNTLYKHLLTIKPTSVDSERAFSNAGHLCTRFRTRLHDKSIDALSFLRSFFQNKKLFKLNDV